MKRKGTGDTGAWDNGGIFTKIWDGEQGTAVVGKRRGRKNGISTSFGMFKKSKVLLTNFCLLTYSFDPALDQVNSGFIRLQ